jgi:WXG100 family type VII secretion target
MSTDTIQAEYAQLEKVAQSFAKSAQSTTQLMAQVQRCANALHGSWIGQGSEAFFAEMAEKVTPAMGRLTAALNQSASTTRQMIAILQAAEADAAAPFRQGETSAIGAGGEGGAAGEGGEVPVAYAKGGYYGPSQSGGATAPAPGSFLANAMAAVGSFKLRGKVGLDGKKELGLELAEGSFFKQEGDLWGGKWKAQELGGLAGVGIKQIDGKWAVGAWGEAYVAKAKLEGTLVGDQNLGWTAGVDAKALSAKAFVGYKDGSVGAEIGGTLVSVRGETGMNIAGANVGVTGEIGLMWKLGISFGQKTEVKLGPFAFGFVFGKAK